ncbi:MAG: Pr6Pr family membrane protein [bacterium]
MRWYRVLMAAAVLAAIGYDYWRVSVQFNQTAGNYLSYFTIQGNLLAAAVLAWGAIRPTPSSATRAILRGAAVLYLLVTGIVYGVLLSGLEYSVVPLVDTILHRVSPVVLALDWLIDRPGRAITLRRATLWLAYPLVYLAYTLLRGLATGWYPYPFLNPGRVGGYDVVAAWCGALALGIVALAGLVLLVGRNARRVEP